MPRLSKKAFEEMYGALGRLLRDSAHSGRDELLRRAFESKDPHLCKRAAEIVAEESLPGFDALMTAAYASMFSDPSKRDPGCHAKTSLAEALDFLDYEDDAPFLRGVAFVQKEGPSPPTDMATGLRGRCGLALVRLRHPDALTYIADLLADPEASVRSVAAQACAYHGDERGAPLLRLKLHVGDADLDVSAETLKAYLALDAKRGLEFARCMLQESSPPLREAVALALGDARPEGALELLVDFLEQATSEREVRVGVVAIFTLRSDEGVAHLRELQGGSDELRARIARETLDPIDTPR